jgi:predicted nucleic acid-binding Zn ribbon protein
VSDFRPERPEPKQVGEGLDRLTRSLSGVGAQPLATVFTEWSVVVGETLAAHCRPLALDGTRLVIGVDESAWATQVRFLETELLERLREVVAGTSVRSIEVRVAPNGEPAKRARKGR